MVWWVDNDTSTAVKPRKDNVFSKTVRWFTDKFGEEATIPRAEWYNMIQGEMLGLANALGITPDKLNDEQIGIALKKALDKIGTDITNLPKVLDSLGDSKKDAASQRIVNVVNKLAKDAMTAANNANDKANQGIAAAKVADGKAVKAQNAADEAIKEAKKRILPDDVHFAYHSNSGIYSAQVSPDDLLVGDVGLFIIESRGLFWITTQLTYRNSVTPSMTQIAYPYDDGDSLLYRTNRHSKGWSEWKLTYSTANTTTSKDGFLRAFGNKEAVTTDSLVVATGTIAHGSTIPIPSGFSVNDCTFFVSTNKMNPEEEKWDIQETGRQMHFKSECFVNNRVVSCRMWVGTHYTTGSDPSRWINGVANYMVIGVKK